MPTDSIEKQRIKFDNGNTANTITARTDSNISDVVKNLDNLNPYKKVILVLGGANELEANDPNKLTQLFGLGIARAAVEACAIIIDAEQKKAS